MPAALAQEHQTVDEDLDLNLRSALESLSLPSGQCCMLWNFGGQLSGL